MHIKNYTFGAMFLEDVERKEALYSLVIKPHSFSETVPLDCEFHGVS